MLVIGGGITGAGVALDAATRGYSVALVEKSDYAAGTSSRSSKLVHGGLRYLQNFDLGLVREALLERQINAALAPHLVRPLPMIVPAFEGARPDRLIGIGLNMYDVMAVDRLRRSPLGRRRVRDRNLDGSEDWSPARHRVIDGAEVAELLPALAAREPTSGYLFYDCQTDDVRLVLTVLGEAERFGAVFANGLEVTGAAGGGRPRARRPRARRRQRRGVPDPRPGGRQRHRRVGRPHPPRGAARRGRGADHPPQPRHPRDRAERAAEGERRRDRPGGRRAHDLRPAVARPDADRDDRQRLRGRHRPRPARRVRRRVPAERGRRVLRHRAGRRRHRGRLRRGAPADLHRRPEEVGRHLAQGRAVRDLERDGHDHRRQADHLAADGEDDRRPPGRARRPRRALPHRRDPARDAGLRARPAARRGRGGGRLRAARRPLRLRGARGAGDRRRARRARPADPARHARPAGRGDVRRPPRAGPQRHRRAAAPHPARADRGALPAGARRAGARARGAGAGGRAGLGRGTRRGARPSASAPTPPRRDWWSAPELPSDPRRNFPPCCRLHRPDRSRHWSPPQPHVPPPRPARPDRPARRSPCSPPPPRPAGSRPPPTRRSTGRRRTSCRSAASTWRATAPAASSTSRRSTASRTSSSRASTAASSARPSASTTASAAARATR